MTNFGFGREFSGERYDDTCGCLHVVPIGDLYRGACGGRFDVNAVRFCLLVEVMASGAGIDDG